MSRQVIEENGKRYEIEDGMVVEAMELLPEEISFEPSQRVEADGKLGRVSAVFDTVYGPTVMVSHDDGSVESYLAEQVVVSKVASAKPETPTEELAFLVNEYNEMTAVTSSELDAKADRAREINIRAKALASDRHTDGTLLLELDEIIAATSIDLLDMKASREVAHLADNQEYLDKLPRSDGISVERGNHPYAAGLHGDMSWIQGEEVQVPEITDDDLARIATTTLERYTSEQLQDRAFVREVLSYILPTVPDNCRVRLAKLFADSREDRLSERIAKEASVEEESFDLNEWDGQELYL